MCSRFAMTSPPEAVRSYFSHRPAEPFPPRYNIAPTQPVHIVRTSEAGQRELVLVRWGLIPSWVKNPGEFTTLINARSETAREKPSFRAAMRHKRCLFPVTGFYEWVGPKGAKRPHLFQRRDGDKQDEAAADDQGLFAFAGLFESWLGADGSEIDTAAILTTTANATVKPIHDRMPVILPQTLFDAWLNCREIDAAEAHGMLAPAPDDFLDVFEVSAVLNNPKNDGPELQQRVRTTLL
ncbi:MAG: SOS response-associated peptidase [Pseudomonadota bacterium]